MVHWLPPLAALQSASFARLFPELGQKFSSESGNLATNCGGGYGLIYEPGLHYTILQLNLAAAARVGSWWLAGVSLAPVHHVFGSISFQTGKQSRQNLNKNKQQIPSIMSESCQKNSSFGYLHIEKGTDEKHGKNTPKD